MLTWITLFFIVITLAVTWRKSSSRLTAAGVIVALAAVWGVAVWLLPATTHVERLQLNPVTSLEHADGSAAEQAEDDGPVFYLGRTGEKPDRTISFSVAGDTAVRTVPEKVTEFTEDVEDRGFVNVTTTYSFSRLAVPWASSTTEYRFHIPFGSATSD
jgi:hypothetical protein